MTKLKMWRLEHGLSQVELSAAAGVPRYVIQLAERGVRSLEPDEMNRLACTLGIKPKDLLSQHAETPGGN